VSRHYRIGEFSKLGGVSIKTLRFYDQIGLLRPAMVDARTRYRLYAGRQLQELTAICALQDLGASLHDIRHVLDQTESDQVQRRLLEKLRRSATHTLAAARRSLLWIDSALGDMSDHAREVPVMIKQRPGVTVASIRAQVKCYAQIDELERELQHAVGSQLAGGLHGVLWHRCAESGAIEGEPFVEIGSRAPRSGNYELKELPAASVATAYCEPDDQDAQRVYEAISRWLRCHDYRLDGPKREIPVGQILEIQFPVKPA
jgi:DNA-binding transcriptional MerR regulator